MRERERESGYVLGSALSRNDQVCGQMDVNEREGEKKTYRTRSKQKGAVKRGKYTWRKVMAFLI